MLLKKQHGYCFNTGIPKATLEEPSPQVCGPAGCFLELLVPRSKDAITRGAPAGTKGLLFSALQCICKSLELSKGSGTQCVGDLFVYISLNNSERVPGGQTGRFPTQGVFCQSCTGCNMLLIRNCPCKFASKNSTDNESQAHGEETS